ncbi:MAG: hypothetical protein ABL931_13740 [Usitatibacteraceae bacterium]
MDHPDKAQRSPVSKHEGHNPDDPRVAVIEDLAMVMCSCCSEGLLRWREPMCKSEWCHSDPHEREGVECEASAMLAAAVELGVPIYTGADLQFGDEDSDYVSGSCPPDPAPGEPLF